MADGIPEGITREDVSQAIADFDHNVNHGFGPSTGYDLLIDGKRYPPKAIVGIAARRLAGRTLTPYDFKGGEASRCFQILRTLGFEIVPKPGYFSDLTTEETNPEKFVEGATRVVAVNSYERNRRAREKCVAHFGAKCAVCGFDFASFYGEEIGQGFIHVHHQKDLASIGEEYEVDPLRDLIPVCPNCHAMLHVETPAMNIQKLREIVEAQRHRRLA